jgi:hypothetical protein
MDTIHKLPVRTSADQQMSAAVYTQSLNVLRDKSIKVALKFSTSNEDIWVFTGYFYSLEGRCSYFLCTLTGNEIELLSVIHKNWTSM